MRSGLSGVGFVTARNLLDCVLKSVKCLKSAPAATFDYATALVDCGRKLFQHRKKSVLSVNGVTVTEATQAVAAAKLVQVYNAFAIE